MTKVVVGQIGSREHYQIAANCANAGVLREFHTDLWVANAPTLQSLLPRSAPPGLVRLAGRYRPDIPAHKVRAKWLSAPYWILKGQSARNRLSRYTTYARHGADFARWSARQLARLDYDAYVGFTGGALEALTAVNESGRLSILDVTAPEEFEEKLISEEQSKFPDLEGASDPIPHVYLDRIAQERNVASRMIVNSEWSKKALTYSGVPPSKITVVPISYEGKIADQPRRRESRLKVLWLSTLCLRKGLPYAVDAARRLLGYPVDFTFVGPSTVNVAALNLPDNCKYLGAVPRIRTHEVWSTHDVYLLPTLSDGFAVTQLEAIANGLPLIVTERCGEVVEHGLSGVVVEPYSGVAIQHALLQFLDGELDLTTASAAALRRASDFRPTKLQSRLLSAITPTHQSAPQR